MKNSVVGFAIPDPLQTDLCNALMCLRKFLYSFGFIEDNIGIPIDFQEKRRDLLRLEIYEFHVYYGQILECLTYCLFQQAVNQPPSGNNVSNATAFAENQKVDILLSRFTPGCRAEKELWFFMKDASRFLNLPIKAYALKRNSSSCSRLTP
ncbi:MAG: hypothetical protein ACUVTL_10555 [Thermoproteota archaeon]